MQDPRECDTAHKVTWQSRASPRSAHVAQRWRRRMVGPHESRQMPRWHHVALGVARLASEEPTG